MSYEIRKLARIAALQAEMFAITALCDGMKVDNEVHVSNQEEHAWTYADFDNARTEFEGIARELRQISQEV